MYKAFFSKKDMKIVGMIKAKASREKLIFKTLKAEEVNGLFRVIFEMNSKRANEKMIGYIKALPTCTVVYEIGR